jgi:hypothetical protein
MLALKAFTVQAETLAEALNSIPVLLILKQFNYTAEMWAPTDFEKNAAITDEICEEAPVTEAPMLELMSSSLTV